MDQNVALNVEEGYAVLAAHGDEPDDVHDALVAKGAAVLNPNPITHRPSLSRVASRPIYVIVDMKM